MCFLNVDNLEAVNHGSNYGVNKSNLDPSATQIRVVNINGLDFNACCGTHVQSLASLQLLFLTGKEKNKGFTRIYFTAGHRTFLYVLHFY